MLDVEQRRFTLIIAPSNHPSVNIERLSQSDIIVSERRFWAMLRHKMVGRTPKHRFERVAEVRRFCAPQIVRGRLGGITPLDQFRRPMTLQFQQPDPNNLSGPRF